MGNGILSRVALKIVMQHRFRRLFDVTIVKRRNATRFLLIGFSFFFSPILDPTVTIIDNEARWILISIIDFREVSQTSARLKPPVRTACRFARCRKTAYIFFSLTFVSHCTASYRGFSCNRGEINPENTAFCLREHPSGGDVF